MNSGHRQITRASALSVPIAPCPNCLIPKHQELPAVHTTEALDKKYVFEYEYDLIPGNVSTIRSSVHGVH